LVVAGVIALVIASDAVALTPIYPPSITSVTPSSGLPGEIITITGYAFQTPVRAVFAFSDGTRKEAFIVSVTWTTLVAITPGVDIDPSEPKVADIILTFDAGTPSELSVVKKETFTFMGGDVAPLVKAVSPTTGSTSGGTRVAILGNGFQAPVTVTVLPDGDEIQIIRVSPQKIDVIMPPSRHGAGEAGFVVTNVGSGKQTTFEHAFLYRLPMVVTSVGPGSGPLVGGTSLMIEGANFSEPVAVVVAGFAARVIDVTPTRIIVVTEMASTSNCRNVSGNVLVMNLNDGGDFTAGPQFTYLVQKPTFVSTSLAGPYLIATLANTSIDARFDLGGRALRIVSIGLNRDGNVAYTLAMPPDAFASSLLRLVDPRTGCTAAARIRFLQDRDLPARDSKP